MNSRLARAEVASEGGRPQPRPGSTASPLRIWLALGTVYLLWGSTYLGIKYAIATIPPLLMGSARFLVAGAVLYALAIRQGDAGRDRLGAPQWLAALLIGGAMLVGGNGGVILAEQTIPSGVVALLVATAPLWMAIIDRLIFGRRLPGLGILGLVIGFGGVAFLIGSPGSGRMNLGGAALGLAAPLCWAAGSVFTRHVKLPTRPLVASSLEMLCAGGLFFIAGVLAGELGRLHWQAISTQSILAVVYLITFGSLVGFTAYVWLLRSAPLSLVSTYAYVNPVVAVLLGTLFLHEALSPRTVIAGGIIVTAVALIVIARQRALQVRVAPVPPVAPVRR
ncbi:MAG: EamA family transporter [Candidatus Dormibacteraeota bacterium]|nr:EamA family transporter [Candidatus Dormibacteraeota bacterium]